MNKSFKLILIGLISLSLLTVGCNKKEEPIPETKVNINENVIKDQEVDGFSMTNTSLVYDEGKTTFITNVTNNTGSATEATVIKINVKDSDGNIITTFDDFIIPLQVGESTSIIGNAAMDITYASSIEYIIEK